MFILGMYPIGLGLSMNGQMVRHTTVLRLIYCIKSYNQFLLFFCCFYNNFYSFRLFVFYFFSRNKNHVLVEIKIYDILILCIYMQYLFYFIFITIYICCCTSYYYYYIIFGSLFNAILMQTPQRNWLNFYLLFGNSLPIYFFCFCYYYYLKLITKIVCLLFFCFLINK